MGDLIGKYGLMCFWLRRHRVDGDQMNLGWVGVFGYVECSSYKSHSVLLFHDLPLYHAEILSNCYAAQRIYPFFTESHSNKPPPPENPISRL